MAEQRRTDIEIGKITRKKKPGEREALMSGQACIFAVLTILKTG